MVSETLLASAVFSLLSGGVFAFVGYSVQRRVKNPDVRLPGAAFTVWWYMLAAATVIGGVHVGVAAFGQASLDSMLLSTQLGLVLFCVALWGLLYHLLYIYTGRAGLWLPLAVGYGLYYVMLLYFVIASQPTGLKTDAWSVQLEYAAQLEGPFIGILIALLLVPQILGAFAYFFLYFRTDDRTARYRISLVSWSIILWFGIPLVSLPLGVSQTDWWQIASRFIGLGAAFAILAAYRPPMWVRTRFQIAAV